MAGIHSTSPAAKGSPSVERRGAVVSIAPAVSQDTVAVLQELLAAARRGDLRGIAFVGVYARKEYVVGYTGLAAQNPTFTRGAVMDLLDDMAKAP